MHLSKLNFFIYFLFFTLPVIGTCNIQDSLEVEKLLKRSLKIVYSNPDSAHFYCKKAFKISKNDEFLKSKSFNYLGIYYDVISNNDSAIICYNKAIDLALLVNSKTAEASALNNLGLIYWNQADYSNAIVFFNKSIVLFEKLDMINGIASAQNNIGLIYNETKNYNKALEYFHKSKVNYLKIKDKYGVSAAYSNLSTTHHFIKNFDSTFYYNRLSIPLKTEIGDNWGLATNFINLATDFNREKQYDSALFYSTRAELLYRNLNNKSNLATALSGKGLFLLNLGHYNKSLKTLKEAESLAIETNSKKTLKNIYNHLASLAYTEKKYKEGYNYLNEQLKIENEIYNSDKNKAITEIQAKYETAKKDKEIFQNREQILTQELIVKSKNNQLLISFFIVSLLIVFSYFIIHFQINKRKKLQINFEVQERIKEANFNQKIAEDKLRISRELHDNIGSHLTFLISSIDNLSFKETSKDKKEKMQKISNFGKQTINELRGTIWAIKNESTSFLELYHKVLDLKKNITSNLIVINQIDEEKILSTTQLLNLYRIIQEAIQNATKYASANQISVSFISNKNQVKIIIKDDGIGFQILDSYESNGIKNMQYRSESINAMLSIKSEKNKGTKVTCTLPI